MVDTTLTEQNNLEIDAKPIVKNHRRRQTRRNRDQKENSSPQEARNETSSTKESTRTNRRSDRRPRQRVPKLGNEGDSSATKEKADYTDGTLRLKISNARPRTVYTRLVRLMLAGFDGAGNALEGGKQIEKIEVSALGNAIGSAIFVIDNLIKGNVVEQASMNCDYVTVGVESDEGRSRGTPRLLASLKRVTTWDSKEDDVLRRTRVFRSKVLGLPEDVDA
jgi:hypothetical protein